MVVPERGGPVMTIGASISSLAMPGFWFRAWVSSSRVRKHRSSSCRVISRPMAFRLPVRSSSVRSESKTGAPVSVEVAEIVEPTGRFDGLPDQLFAVEGNEVPGAAYRVAHVVDAAHPVGAGVEIGEVASGGHGGS